MLDGCQLVSAGMVSPDVGLLWYVQARSGSSMPAAFSTALATSPTATWWLARLT